MANISGTNPHIENRKPVYQLPPLPRWVKKVAVLWSINKKVIEPNVYIYIYTIMYFFRETTFRPLGGAAPSHFYTR